jgi:hypothetical protein
LSEEAQRGNGLACSSCSAVEQAPKSQFVLPQVVGKGAPLSLAASSACSCRVFLIIHHFIHDQL